MDVFKDLVDFQVSVGGTYKDLDAQCGTGLDQNSYQIGWK